MLSQSELASEVRRISFRPKQLPATMVIFVSSIIIVVLQLTTMKSNDTMQFLGTVVVPIAVTGYMSMVFMRARKNLRGHR